MKKILFYPGTFNPPHIAHESILMQALSVCSPDEIWIMPSGKRKDKEIRTPLIHIKKMSEIFVNYLRDKISIPIKLITTAVDVVDGKYTHEHIIALKAETKDQILQLVGIDGFLAIKERVVGYEEKYLISKRAGYDIPREILLNENRIILEEKISGVSSTKIREMIKKGDNSYKDLLHPNIITYIQENNLYISE